MEREAMHNAQFNKRQHANNTTLWKHIWQLKKKAKMLLNINVEYEKTLPANSNILK